MSVRRLGRCCINMEMGGTRRSNVQRVGKCLTGGQKSVKLSVYFPDNQDV